MDYTKISEKEVLNWLKENLDEKRYEHSVGTAEYAQFLAKKYGLNEKKCYIAGLLHDCAKCFPEEKMLDILKNYTDANEEELQNPKTWHAPVSSYIANKVFKVEDEEILSAIRWHTLGKIEMSTFEKVIFLSDKVELKTRKKEYSQLIRDSIDNGLDEAMLICYKETIKSLIDRGLTICPLTIDIYNKLINVN